MSQSWEVRFLPLFCHFSHTIRPIFHPIFCCFPAAIRPKFSRVRRVLTRPGPTQAQSCRRRPCVEQRAHGVWCAVRRALLASTTYQAPCGARQATLHSTGMAAEAEQVHQGWTCDVCRNSFGSRTPFTLHVRGHEAFRERRLSVLERGADRPAGLDGLRDDLRAAIKLSLAQNRSAAGNRVRVHAEATVTCNEQVLRLCHDRRRAARTPPPLERR